MKNNLDDSYRYYKEISKLIGENMYMCEKCNMKTPGRKRVTTNKWPKELIIVLKRFNNNLVKNNSNIHIPLQWRHGYKLKGGVLHSGSLGGGHYVYFGMKNNKWYLFNDSSVSEISDIENYKNKDLGFSLHTTNCSGNFSLFLDICSITFIMENEVPNTALELPSVNDLT